MKSFLLVIAILCSVGLASGLASTGTNVANTAKKQRALMNFAAPTTLMGVTLKGNYLFVHNDEAMARGDACTFVYKGDAELPDKLAVSFHCMPVARPEAKSFRVYSLLTAPGHYEIREFQFAGSTEGHLVPLSQHAEHVTIATHLTREPGASLAPPV